MVEPVTLSLVGAVALTEGIKFLYGQAGELLKRRRERAQAAEAGQPQEGSEPVRIDDPGVLAGELQPVVVDDEALERLEPDIQRLTALLGNYANGFEVVDEQNEELLQATDGLRRVLEAIFQQRITFRGETAREPSGPLVEGRIDVDEVAGYVAVVRADSIEESVSATGRAKRVEAGGEMIVVDAKRIGGRRPPPD